MGFKHTLLTLAAMAAASPALAVPVPKLKPENPAVASRLLQGEDYRCFVDALAEGRDRNWNAHGRLQNAVSDPLAKNILTWQRALYDPDAPFDQVTHVVQNLGNWPRMVSISAKGERTVLDSATSPQQVISWFGGREPVSGEGRIALAKAHLALGNRTDGLRYLRLGWRESKLSRSVQQDVFREFGSRLTADDHAARADHLIWLGRSHLDKAKALLPHVPPGERALLDARIALRGRERGVNAKIEAVPAALRTRPELQFERSYWRRAKIRDRDQALEPLLAMTEPVASEAGREQVWREKKIHAYRLIGEGRHREAYPLTQNLGLSEGLGFQESEFLAGWLSLRYLRDAAQAEQHFRRLRAGVSRPISMARGAYWTGRALESQGKSDQARMFYEDAAQHLNTYYGQMAMERLGRTDLVLPPQPAATPLDDYRTRAMRMLGEAGATRLLDTFSFHMDDEADSLEELVAVGETSRELGSLKASVRAGKQAGRFGTFLRDLGYPTPVAISELGRGYDVPFTFAIARQESEFDPGAVSSAKAYGMMQMIDATARLTARKHGLKYSRDRMLSDEFYAARMGSLHLNDLLQRYDGSYIMAAAAYNAGPSRVTRWVAENGDPRRPDVDAIDWVESIPFSETRNYVQRVMENMQVYRARTNGNRTRLGIAEAVGAR